MEWPHSFPVWMHPLLPSHQRSLRLLIFPQHYLFLSFGIITNPSEWEISISCGFQFYFPRN
jgi:hypothetical protein